MNPFLISHPYLRGHDELPDSTNDDLCGWCIFDSICTNRKEKTNQGFGGTLFTKLEASLGVRLFLNICASYLKLKRNADMNQVEAPEFDYEEPFGNYRSNEVVPHFIRLDYKTPNIIHQQNSYDCGFAAVANAMAFVLSMRDVPFTYSDIRVGVGQCTPYVMKHRNHRLNPFWHELMSDAKSKYGNCSNSSDVLMYM